MSQLWKKKKKRFRKFFWLSITCRRCLFQLRAAVGMRSGVTWYFHSQIACIGPSYCCVPVSCLKTAIAPATPTNDLSLLLSNFKCFTLHPSYITTGLDTLPQLALLNKNLTIIIIVEPRLQLPCRLSPPLWWHQSLVKYCQGQFHCLAGDFAIPLSRALSSAISWWVKMLQRE